MTLTYKLNLGKVTLNDNAKYLQCRSKVISFDSNHTVTHTPTDRLHYQDHKVVGN